MDWNGTHDNLLYFKFRVLSDSNGKIFDFYAFPGIENPILRRWQPPPDHYVSRIIFVNNTICEEEANYVAIRNNSRNMTVDYRHIVPNVEINFFFLLLNCHRNRIYDKRL